MKDLLLYIKKKYIVRIDLNFFLKLLSRLFNNISEIFSSGLAPHMECEVDLAFLPNFFSINTSEVWTQISCTFNRVFIN